MDFCSIDGTMNNQFGVFVNDSKFPNCIMRMRIINNRPHLCLYALEDISEMMELRYDYQDSNLWWRKEVNTLLSYANSVLKLILLLLVLYFNLPTPSPSGVRVKDLFRKTD